jgi:ABC-type multidrug transport system fused ATPase/permease subunit
MFVKSFTVTIGTIVILFTYSWALAFIIIACVLPPVVIMRYTASILNAFSVRYQKAKSEMSNIATEQLSNVRTVKSFASEHDTGLNFALASQEVFEYGRSKGYFWGLYFIAQKKLQSVADIAIIYIVSRTFGYFDLSIGEVTAILLYVRTIMSNAGTITNNVQAVSKVFGSSYEIAVLIVTPNMV